MTSSLCISIPAELKRFQIVPPNARDENSSSVEFGVRMQRGSNGEVQCAAYYSDSGELLKKVYYNGAFVANIIHYRNGHINIREEYHDDKITRKIFYNKEANIQSCIVYAYNRLDKITSINKFKDGKSYRVDYGYDDLNRVNSRKISIDGNIIKEQKYRYDILDRIVDYEDNSQKIKINRMSTKNELISYTIIDKMNNRIEVNNKFNICGSYEHTEIVLNEHKIVIKDSSYLDNVMLKKPYTTEDDLDLIIANLFKPSSAVPTKRTDGEHDISENVIAINIKPVVLPISLRKRLMYKQATSM